MQRVSGDMTQTASKTAYITGGASGIGFELVTLLLDKGWYVCVADKDVGKMGDTERLLAIQCDTSSWDSQATAFRTAIDWRSSDGGRIDFVAPIAGIGERQWLPLPEVSASEGPHDFAKPNLSVIDIDLTGVLYTVALSIQHFRRQTRIEGGLLGRIGLVASVCGMYCVPSLPIYTAAKHALIGLTRSYGKLLLDEGITVNALAPNVVRTSISAPQFYEMLGKKNLLTPMDGLMKAFETILDTECSGEIFECGPAGGWVKREATAYVDEESGELCRLLDERARPLHYGLG